MNAEKLEEISSLCKSLNLLYVVRDKNNENNNLKYFENFFNELTFVSDKYKAEFVIFCIDSSKVLSSRVSNSFCNFIPVATVVITESGCLHW